MGGPIPIFVDRELCSVLCDRSLSFVKRMEEKHSRPF